MDKVEPIHAHLLHKHHYLHYWNEEQQRWTNEEEEKKSNYGGLMFPEVDGTARAYPWGYKMWMCRNLADAPEWVLTRRQQMIEKQQK